jgi:hypothetical protein
MSNLLLNGVELFGTVNFVGLTSPTANLQPLQIVPVGNSTELFGYSMATQNNVMVIGDYSKTISGISNVGAAYVYTLTGNVWSLTATLGLTTTQLSKAGSAAHFGGSVSISGNWIAVSAPGYRLGATGGAVFLYQFSGGSWSTTPVQEIDFTDGSGYYGWSIALDQNTGNTLAIGQPKASSGLGIVEIWRVSGSTWSKTNTLSYTGTLRSASTQGFGYSVALNNNVLVAGGPGNFTGTGMGLSFISNNNTGTWTTPIGINPGSGVSDGFGASVSTRAGLVAIGSPTTSVTTNGGKVYLYDTSGNYITTLSVASNGSPTILDPNVTNAAKMGYSVDIDDSGSYVISGAPGYLNPTNITSGAAYLFQNNGTTWGPSDFSNAGVSRIDPSVKTNNQRMGFCSSFNHSGTFGILLGAPGTSLQGRFYWF